MASQLHAMVKHLLPNLPEASYAKYVSYFLRVLSSRTHAVFLGTEEQLAGLLCERAADCGKAKKLFYRVLSSKAVSRKKTILYCLYILAKEPSAESERLNEFNKLLQPERGYEPMLVDLPASAAVHEHCKVPSLFLNVAEHDVLHDLLHIFQGADGKYIKYSSSANSYLLAENVAVLHCVRQLVMELSELGWLYRQVTVYVEERGRDESSGRAVQSFCRAVQGEVEEYLKLLETLQGQLQESGRLSLMKLKLWMQDPMERMKWLYIMCCSANSTLNTKGLDLKGGALASTLQQHVAGSPGTLHGLLSKLLEETCKPLLSMVQLWMVQGDACDLHGDFFVVEDLKVLEDRLWTAKYSLRVELVPTFLSYDHAYKIYLAGKAINFIRKCCGEAEWEVPSALKEPGTRSWSEITSNPGVIDEWVVKIYEATNSQVVNLLFTKYRLLDHYESIRKYLLLGQGDFHQHLISLVYEPLSKPAEQIYK